MQSAKNLFLKNTEIFANLPQDFEAILFCLWRDISCHEIEGRGPLGMNSTEN